MTDFFEIYLWSTQIDATASEIARWRRTLTSSEIARGERFHFDHDRKEFWGGRTFLRHVLGTHLDIPASEVQFAVGPNGKPELVTGAIQFNYARSRQFAVCAIANQRSVGVDVERMREIADMESLAATVMSDQEFNSWNQLAPSCKPSGFFSAWTYKEARGKASGVGISNGTRGLPIPERWDSNEIAHEIRDSNQRWLYSAWQPFHGTAAAVVLELNESEKVDSRYEDTEVSATHPRQRWLDQVRGTCRSSQLVVRRFRSQV